jgi:hypothetical protein
MGLGHHQPIMDSGTSCRGESCSPRIAVDASRSQRQLLLAYNAAGHQYLSTKTIQAVIEWLPPNLAWMRRFLGDTATPTVYRDMTDVWTLAHWRDTPDAQRHHFMRASGQTYDAAYKEAVDWIRQNGRQASFNLRRVWKESLGYYDPLFVTEPLGDAFHALQDSFSAGHVERQKLGTDYVITAINVYDSANKETHSELDKEWQSPLGEEAIVACRELTKIIIVSALQKTNAEFEAKWTSLWATFQEFFLQANFTA